MFVFQMVSKLGIQYGYGMAIPDTTGPVLNVSRFLQYLGPQSIGNYTIIYVGIPLGLLYSVVDTCLHVVNGHNIHAENGAQ